MVCDAWSTTNRGCDGRGRHRGIPRRPLEVVRDGYGQNVKSGRYLRRVSSAPPTPCLTWPGPSSAAKKPLHASQASIDTIIEALRAGIAAVITAGLGVGRRPVPALRNDG